MIIGLVVIVMFWGVATFNRLIGDRNLVLSSWSDIQVQLKRRHDLLEKLVAAVRQYADYAQAVLTQVIELRRRADGIEDIAQRGLAETDLSGAALKLFLLAEQYPELKANQNFLDLQHQISDVERTIQLSRRFYNGAVRALNTRIDSFPSLLIAKLFSFQAAKYFELDADVA